MTTRKRIKFDRMHDTQQRDAMSGKVQPAYRKITMRTPLAGVILCLAAGLLASYRRDRPVRENR